MHENGKSDNSILPEIISNKDHDASRSAERHEGRELAKSNEFEQNRYRTQSRESLQSALERIRQAAARDKRQRLTSLWHHVYDIGRLQEEYFNLKSQSAPGIDGVWYNNL